MALEYGVLRTALVLATGAAATVIAATRRPIWPAGELRPVLRELGRARADERERTTTLAALVAEHRAARRQLDQMVAQLQRARDERIQTAVTTLQAQMVAQQAELDAKLEKTVQLFEKHKKDLANAWWNGYGACLAEGGGNVVQIDSRPNGHRSN